MGSYNSLNLGFNSGDDIDIILKNYEGLIKNYSLENKLLYLTNQVHGDRVKLIRKEEICLDEDMEKLSIRDKIHFIDDHDGMVTDSRDIVLMTFYADCVPLVFFDPVKKIIGNCHAGWRGTVKKIPMQVINTMQKEFNSSPSDILVAIGPSASSCCYEVDDRVIDEFKEAYKNADELYTKKASGKYMLDLKKANLSTLIESGLSESNVNISESCTICNNDSFFSYRLENGKTGRHSAIITIK